MNEAVELLNFVSTEFSTLPTPKLFLAAFAAVLGFLAFGQVLSLVDNIVDRDNDFAKARNLGVTDKMLERLNLSLLMFLLFVFYGMISGLIGVAHEADVRVIDTAINFALILGVVYPLMRNVLDLILRGTFKFKRFVWQAKQLAKRGVKFTNLATTLIATVFKYELSGMRVIDPALATFL
jgi:hypothetical protein